MGVAIGSHLSGGDYTACLHAVQLRERQSRTAAGMGRPTLEALGVDGFRRDVADIGHFGTGDLEITIRSMGDFEKAKPLLIQAYEVS